MERSDRLMFDDEDDFDGVIVDFLCFVDSMTSLLRFSISDYFLLDRRVLIL